MHVHAGGGDDLARGEHRDVVVQGLAGMRAVILGHLELAGGEVQKRDAEPGLRIGGSLQTGHGEQERRFARVEIAGVGQRARRYHPHDLAPDHAFRLTRVLDLLADRHPVALADQAGDVAVGGMVGHAAHRHGGAGRVLGARGERQVEGAGGDQRVLVEQLVEVAHPEQHQGKRMLALGLEVLAHRGRDRRAEGGEGRRGIGCAGQDGLC